MSELMKTDKSYAAWVHELRDRYRCSQIKASMAVNSEVQRYYWSVGRDILARDAENVYGSHFYDSLSRDLTSELHEAKGFSPANLRYMKRFYELFPATNKNLPQLAEDSTAQAIPQEGMGLFAIPWGHIRLLIEKCKGDGDKALFYVQKTLDNNWGKYLTVLPSKDDLKKLLDVGEG